MPPTAASQNIINLMPTVSRGGTQQSTLPMKKRGSHGAQSYQTGEDEGRT